MRPLIALLILLSFVAPAAAGERAPVRSVRTPDGHGYAMLRERARLIGNEVYPRLRELFWDRTLSTGRRFDIIFEPKPLDKAGNLGTTTMSPFGCTIRLDGSYFLANPSMLDTVLAHELAHMAQQYRSSRVPAYWVEGLADYGRLKMAPDSPCPECSAGAPHYTAGYGCAAAFLLFVESVYGPRLIQELDRDLRLARYSEEVFPRCTGRSLPQLWEDFAATPSVTPAAKAINQAHQELGFVEGRAPKAFQPKLDDYLTRLGAAEEHRWRTILQYPKGQAPRDLGRRVERFLIAEHAFGTDPAGLITRDAVEFVWSLKLQGLLPGWGRSVRGEIHADRRADVSQSDYPASRILRCNQRGSPDVIFYQLNCASPKSGWSLRRAWRSSPEGLVTELPLRR